MGMGIRNSTLNTAGVRPTPTVASARCYMGGETPGDLLLRCTPGRLHWLEMVFFLMFVWFQRESILGPPVAQ